MVSDTFCAVLIAPSSWLTRCEIGALDPTHGQFAAAARAGVAGAAAPTTANVPTAAVAVASAISRRIPNTRMTPPGTRFTDVGERFLQNVN